MPTRQEYPQFSDRNLRVEFRNSFEEAAAKTYIPSLSTFVKSTREYESYAWLGTPPVMREWKGGRQIKKPTDFSWVIYNKKYEATIGLPIEDIERDTTGQFINWAQDLGQRAAENPVILMSNLLLNGETFVGFDGAAFWSTSHDEGGGTNVNKITASLAALGVTDTGTTTDPSPQAMSKIIFKMIQQLMTFKDDQGQPVNQTASNFAIVSGLGLMPAISAAVNQMIFAQGSQNPLMVTGNTNGGRRWNFETYFDPRLTWTTKLAIFRTDTPVKPFFHQVERDNRIVYQTDPNSDRVFERDEYAWGVSRIEGVGYGDYKKTVLATITS